MSSEEFVNLPQPDQLPEREKEDGMGAYLMMFAAFAVGLPLPVINLIAALIYYFVNRKKSRFIHFHCLQSFLSQIPTTLLNWGLLYWGLQVYFFHNHLESNFFFAYIVLVIIANLIYVIFSIVAAVNYNEKIEFLMSHPHNNARIKRSLEYKPSDYFKTLPFDLDWNKIKEGL